MSFVKGIIIGFLIAAPLGPIGILCIRRTLKDGFYAGILTGLGAASADAFYALLGSLGITAVSIFLIDQKDILGLVGGIFLVYLGIRILMAAGAEGDIGKSGKLGNFSSSFFLTITNPITILSFAALFVANGIGKQDVFGSVVLVAGVFAGSVLWWLILAIVADYLKNKLNIKVLKIVNVVSGLVIAAFGLLAASRYFVQ